MLRDHILPQSEVIRAILLEQSPVAGRTQYPRRSAWLHGLSPPASAGSRPAAVFIRGHWRAHKPDVIRAI